MEEIVQGPHPPVLSFMSGNWNISQFLEIGILFKVSKIENNSVLKNEIVNLERSLLKRSLHYLDGVSSPPIRALH